MSTKPSTGYRTTPYPTHLYAGVNSDRQSIGLPGHCERCAEVGHVRAHPSLGCGDVGCEKGHGDADEAAANARSRPPSVVADQIICWFEVCEGDLVAFDGKFRQLVQMWPTLLPAPYDLGVRLLHGGMAEDFQLDSNSVVGVRRYDTSEEQDDAPNR